MAGTMRCAGRVPAVWRCQGLVGRSGAELARRVEFALKLSFAIRILRASIFLAQGGFNKGRCISYV
jgi:hypothetical protein